MIRDKVMPVLWLMLAAVIIGGSLGFSARAHAGDGYCTTNYYSNATYTICTWTDTTGYQHRTVETCLDGSNSCSIKGN